MPCAFLLACVTSKYCDLLLKGQKYGTTDYCICICSSYFYINIILEENMHLPKYMEKAINMQLSCVIHELKPFHDGNYT